MLLNIIKELNVALLAPKLVEVRVGETVKVIVSSIENSRERTQVVEGLIIAVRHSGLNKTITLRRVVQGVGVERTYFLNSPRLKEVIIINASKVCKSKLYYLRSRFGKAARLQQRFN